jgi:hypothetical protein
VEVLDPLGIPQGVRAWLGGTADHFGETAIGIDPVGNAVFGGYSMDQNGGSSYFLVRLAP